MTAQVRMVAVAVVIAWMIPTLAWPTEDCQCEHRGPEAAGRSYAVNYRDLVLANCIAKAYRTDADASMDAGSSASALLEWTAYNMDAANMPMRDIFDRYLDRRYTDPGRNASHKDVRFDFMKCLDLYHSAGLQDQVRRYVGDPDRTARQDAKAMNLDP